MENHKKKNDDILEGEVINEAPQKVPPHSHEKKFNPNINIFSLPVFAKTKRDCSLGCGIFIVSIVLAIALKNGLFVLLGILLPWWLFSRKK